MTETFYPCTFTHTTGWLHLLLFLLDIRSIYTFEKLYIHSHLLHTHHIPEDITILPGCYAADWAEPDSFVGLSAHPGIVAHEQLHLPPHQYKRTLQVGVDPISVGNGKKKSNLKINSPFKITHDIKPSLCMTRNHSPNGIEVVKYCSWT